MDVLVQWLNFWYEVIELLNNVYGNCMEFNNGIVFCDGMVKMLVDQVRNIFILKCSVNLLFFFFIDINQVYLYI